MPVTISYPITFVVETCCNCGIQFAMPEEFQARCLREGGSFYCPNGHSQHYSETTEQKLKHKLASVQGKLANIEFELIAERNAHEATTKKLKRTEKRVSKGVCPCCHRQFVNVRRHMKSQHPEYVDAV